MPNLIARDLRRAMTDPERLLWYLLRAKRFGGCKFRRQHPIGPFIVDFACVQRRLIIEADGGRHAEFDDDTSRTKWLESQGWRVLKFWNHDIVTRTESVLQEIFEAMDRP